MFDNIGSILSAKIIATQVKLIVKLHRGIEFRNEEEKSLQCDRSVMVKDLGNVTRDNDITFEYRMKRVKELLEIEELDLEKLKSLPF
jgi:hypothetical protein